MRAIPTTSPTIFMGMVGGLLLMLFPTTTLLSGNDGVGVGVHAFHLPVQHHHHHHRITSRTKTTRTTTRLWGTAGGGREGGGGGGYSSNHNNNNNNESFLNRNIYRTDIRTFLTQRTIQTFVFLLGVCREEANIRWLENFLDFTNIDKFHGTGAFNSTAFATWDAIFLEMVSRQNEQIIIEVVSEDSQRRRRRRGLSGHNSYLESLSKPPAEREVDDQEMGARNPYLEETTVEYTFDIDPASLVRRMVSVREQIAAEWVYDLDILTQLNDEIMESYEEYLDEQEQLMDMDDEDDNDEDNDDIEGNTVEVKTSSSTEDVGGKGLTSIDDLLKPYSDRDSDDNDEDSDTMSFSAVEKADKAAAEKGKMKPIFDRNAIFKWGQSLCRMDREESHFRRQSFELLLLLATQESIHRVLAAYKKSDEDQAESSSSSGKVFSSGKSTSYEWLLDFYKDRVEEYFDGYQTTGNAEAFLEDLLRTPPTVIESATEVVAFIDPARVAEDIIRERSEVALDWREIVKNIPEDHTDVRRHLFSSMMMKNTPTAEENSVAKAATGEPTQAAIDAITKDIAKNIMTNTTSAGIFE